MIGDNDFNEIKAANKLGGAIADFIAIEYPEMTKTQKWVIAKKLFDIDKHTSFEEICEWIKKTFLRSEG